MAKQSIPKLDPVFEMAAKAAFYEVAGNGESEDFDDKSLRTVGGKIVQRFLDGRFRHCLRKAMRFLIIDKDGPQLKQSVVARELGVRDEQVRKCKEGTGLMSGAAWTWFVCRMGDDLEEFRSPTLEQRAIAGYCEAMAFIDAEMRGRKTIDFSDQPCRIDFLLLWVAFGSDILTRDKLLREPKLLPRQAEAMLRLLNQRYPRDIDIRRLDSPEKLRREFVIAAERWAVPYAVVVSRIVLDWTKERRRVT